MVHTLLLIPRSVTGWYGYLINVNLFLIVVLNVDYQGLVKHYNIIHFPRRKFGAFPSDMLAGIPFPSDLSLGNVRWGKLDRDTFPSDNLQQNGGTHLIFSQRISATEAHNPQRHVAGESPI
ncbi:hypothetical protein Tco_0200892 [Tanacetum coccineum]